MAPTDERTVERLLDLTEHELVPAVDRAVSAGNKLFGGAVLRKDDLSTVVVTGNNETEFPLWHGEMWTLRNYWALPRVERPAPRDCLFFASHEPCSLCLSAITWMGFDNFYYLFSYFDSRDSFAIPHDLNILAEVFRCDDGAYARENRYWTSYAVSDLIEAFEEEPRRRLEARVVSLKQRFDELSAVYQASKGEADIPLP